MHLRIIITMDMCMLIERGGLAKKKFVKLRLRWHQP